MAMRRVVEVGNRGILEFIRTFRIGIYRDRILYRALGILII